MVTKGDRLKLLVGMYQRDNTLAKQDEEELRRIVIDLGFKEEYSDGLDVHGKIHYKRMTLDDVVSQAAYAIGISTIIDICNEESL